MMDNLASTLIVNTAVFSALVLLMLLLRRRLMTKISPALMLVLWAVVVIKLVIPFGFESRMGIIPHEAAPTNTGVSVAAGTGMATPDVFAVQKRQTANETTGAPIVQAAQTEAIQTTASAARPIDGTAVGLSIWAAGVLAAALAFGFGAAGLIRRLRHARLPVSDRVRNILDESRVALGIRRRVRVVMTEAQGSPLISDALRPVILLPGSTAQLSDAALRHVLLHELMHLRRGDLTAIRLINMLCALYWFNPLVWLACRLIREDIETACDHCVIRVIGTDQRLLYIGTVLRFAGRAANVDHTAAAMGMADGRPAMEKRIQGMYRVIKTGMKGRAVAALIAVMMLATGVLTACQPTPDEAVVVNRSELEEKIAATATPGATYEPYEAADHWTDTIERGALTVSADTDVTLPGVDQYPVTILEPVMLSQERIDEMVHYFVGDSKLFCYPSVFTKADYQEMLIEARRGQLTDGEYVVTEGTERYAKSLEEKVANAPEDSPRVYTDTTLTYDTDLDGNVNYDAGASYVSLGVECEDGNEATISAHNFTAGYGNSTSFGFYRMGGSTSESWYQECLTYGDESESGFDGYGEIFDSIDLGINDARAQADKVISDLGIKDMALVNEEKAVLPSLGDQYGVCSNRPDCGGYVFEYVRASGGIPGYQLTSFGTDGYDQEPDYSPPFFQEMLTICVSEDGIEGFSWSGMAQVVETVSENVTLLPFADIQQALVDQIYYENAPKLEQFNESESADVLGEMAVKVDVLLAELRVGYISVKDNTQQAMLVPMWVFETTETHSYGDERGEPFASKTYQFNAIDGGVIMPSVGAVAAEEDAIIAAEQEQE